MPADLKFLREHYASLSDEALLAINRAELVEAAQRCYDEELAKRKPDPEFDEAVEAGSEPDWLEDAAEVLSRADLPGTLPGAELEDARDALEAAGIPCQLELSEMTEVKDVSPAPTHRWRLLVPGALNQRATSVLERDIFNTEFESEWRTHLEMLSDDELRAMDPQEAFCGLFDRVERVTRAYDEELERRGI